MTTKFDSKALQALDDQIVQEAMGIYPTTAMIPDEEDEELGFEVTGPEEAEEYPSLTITEDGDLVHTDPLAYDNEALDAEYDLMLDEDDAVIYADNIPAPAERELTPSEERSARVGQGIILRAVQGDTKALMMLRDVWDLYHAEIIAVMWWLVKQDRAREEAVDDTIYLLHVMAEHHSRTLDDMVRCAGFGTNYSTVTVLILHAIRQQDAGAQQLMALLWADYREELMAKMAEMVAQGYLPEDAVYEAENVLDLETTPATASMYRLAAAKIRQAGQAE